MFMDVYYFQIFKPLLKTTAINFFIIQRILMHT